MHWYVLGLIVLLALVYIITTVMGNPLVRRRRERMSEEPFPAEWEEILERRLAIYRQMPEDLQKRLREHVQVLMAEKRFEACGGLRAITDEMRVLILGQAALLLIGRQGHRYFRDLRSILLYPSTYVDHGRRKFGLFDGEEDDGPDARLGESWHSGSVVLAWDSVKKGAARADDGMNVTLHEFAHQLDQADGSSDGAPTLARTSDYAEWSRVFQSRYEELLDDVQDGRNPLLDEYGATNPAEFFAVATEVFFERPDLMREEMEDLYEQLSRYYGLDPADW